MPDGSTDEQDVYAVGVRDLVRASRSVVPLEPKVLRELNDFVFDRPKIVTQAMTPAAFVGPMDTQCCSRTVEVNGVDVGSYMAGEKLDARPVSVAVKSKAVKRRKKLGKRHWGKQEAVIDVGEKVMKMLRKLHMGWKSTV